MNKILFMNCSPNKNGNTYRIGEKILDNIEHNVLQMSDYKIYQYGQVYEDDQIKEVFDKIEKADTIVIGSPVYWYTVGGILKTFIDRFYMLDEAKKLHEKKLYLFAQGDAPDNATKKSIEFLANRVSILMDMELKSVIISTSDGNEIINNMIVES